MCKCQNVSQKSSRLCDNFNDKWYRVFMKNEGEKRKKNKGVELTPGRGCKNGTILTVHI